MKLNNTYFILRHGEAKSNKEEFLSSWPETVKNPLTEKGKKQIQKIILELKKKNIDLIFSSCLLRTRQTAKIIAKSLELDIIFDKRLREIETGEFNGSSIEKWRKFFIKAKRFIKRPPKGENWTDVRKRVVDSLNEINKEHKNKNILIVSHGDPLFLLQGAIKEFSEEDMLKNKNNLKLETGEYRKLKFKIIYGYTKN